MSELNLFHGPNAGYAEELYDRYRHDPNTVDATTRAFFDAYPLPLPHEARNGHSTEKGRIQDSGFRIQGNAEGRDQDSGFGIQGNAEEEIQSTIVNRQSSIANAAEVMRITTAAARLSRRIRQHGHLKANVDPLGLSKPEDPKLELSDSRLTEAELASLPAGVVVGSLIEAKAKNALEAINRLREVYMGSIGYETEHIQTTKERYWLRDAADSGRFFADFDAEAKRALLRRLTQVDAFEQSIHKRYPTKKRFSIEGTDMLVPMLDEIFRCAAHAGTREAVIGMAHRGRLNVLTNVMGKPAAAIFEGFKVAQSDDDANVPGNGVQGRSGDVKYHLGYKGVFSDQGVHQEAGVPDLPLALMYNPSHLEFVNPVAEGYARAAQEMRDHAGPPVQDPLASLAILIHGDAAFPGQGVVAETLNLSRLPGYATGGTIHIISNNQVGFTTGPREGRSTLYASDLAKGFEIPIVHVNADDPLACLAVARMAHEYRVTFGKDFLIDLVGYRRYGHNEAEEPEVTQPVMYAQVFTHPRVRQIWAETLQKEGLVTAEEAQTLWDETYTALDPAWTTPYHDTHHEAEATGLPSPSHNGETAVPTEQLTAYNEALYALPADFAPNDKLNRRTLQGRREGLDKADGILWGHAEALAFASILAEGTPIRLTGQDTERGTFSHRHAVLYDILKDARFIGLQTLPQARAAFGIYNSPLSEIAALGFEYGYSVQSPETLVLWEAQFGDFGNGAQVIIDQFLAGGLAKWDQKSSLVLLLPHGYEGQGPEHSSARLERFLQLAAEDNLRIANCTTPAQYFHLLRRQAALLTTAPRPLIVMTPKSLLRAPAASSSLSDLTAGAFQPVLDDARAQLEPAQVTRLILCSGKVYLDLVYKGGTEGKALRPEWEQAENIAAVRVEELYPFPARELQQVIEGYPNLREIVWLQEEPKNMGAWRYLEICLRDQLGKELRYCGRPASASPAVGAESRHHSDQSSLLRKALTDVPPINNEVGVRD